MNEWTKTGVFGGLALVVVVVAVISKPRIENVARHEMEGKLLFADKFDEENRDTAARREIGVVGSPGSLRRRGDGRGQGQGGGDGGSAANAPHRFKSVMEPHILLSSGKNPLKSFNLI